MSMTDGRGSRGGGTEPVRDAPPAHLLPVLRELLAGTLDVTASRRLNMSPRTFNRRVAELLQYLGAQTRFQGGVQAVMQGLAPLSRGPGAAHQPMAVWPGNAAPPAGSGAWQRAHPAPDRHPLPRQLPRPADRSPKNRGR